MTFMFEDLHDSERYKNQASEIHTRHYYTLPVSHIGDVLDFFMMAPKPQGILVGPAFSLSRNQELLCIVLTNNTPESLVENIQKLNPTKITEEMYDALGGM